jgi:ribosome-binding ATPase
MKIGYHDVNVPEGKTKYNDARMNKIVEKCNPKKVTPYYIEFMKDEFVQSEAIVISKKSILDLLLYDLEKCESRLERSESDTEKALLQKCMSHLEAELPLCDLELVEADKEVLRSMSVVSLKPVVVLEGEKEVTEIIDLCLDKSGIVFFYTAGPKEVHAWQIAKDSDIVTCAGRIHTDLARGFIKGDIAGYDDYISCHNWNDCQRKGLIKVVDRDYKIKPGDVIEIRFNV